MDGTGLLFASFVSKAPCDIRPIVVPLTASGSYAELRASITDSMPQTGSFTIVAESFSGPLAIQLAVACADRIDALVLVNTFVLPPRSAAFRVLPWSLILAVPPPRWVVRALLTGTDAAPQLVDSVRAAIAQTGGVIRAARMRSIFAVNEVANLKRLRCPLLYLRGTDDHLVTKRSGDVIVKNNPNVRRQDIAAPHLLLQTSPEEAWKAIERFLRDPT